MHEAGHALVGLLTPESTPLYSVTILPRGGALGYTSFAPDKEVYLMTKGMYEAQLDVSLGGRVAEEIFFGNKEITTGCGSDLKATTSIAYGLARELAMSDSIMISTQKQYLSEGMNQVVDKEAQKIIQKAYKRTKELLLRNKEDLGKFAKVLLKKETMSAQEVRDLLHID